MSRHGRFHIKSLDELRREIGAQGLAIPVTDDVSILKTPLSVGGRTVPNRFAVQPMEGFDATPDGAPGELSFRRYTRYARGGFGLVWMEATAVVNEGRSNPGQFYLHKGNVGVYRDLVATMRKAAKEAYGRDLVVVIQLTHSGRYSKPTGVPRPIIAHRSPILDPLHQLPADYPVITDEALDRLQDIYVEAARLAAEAGVDGVDIKSCHRYLVSELHASFTREGRYGGSFENRTRLIREVMAKIRDAVPQVFITTRMSAFDAIPRPYGFGMKADGSLTPDLAEPRELVKAMEKLGIPLLNISIGNPYYNPHFGRPYDFPIFGMQPPDEHPLAALDRFLGITRALQESFPNLPVVGSGYSWLRQFLPNVGAAAIEQGGAALLGVGRGAFAYPDSVRDVLETGRMDPAKCCVACSACTQIMRDGGLTGCVVRDSEIYGPQYRLGRRFAVDRLREEAKRCRDCEEATCTRGCPAHVDVPGFLKAFANGDIAKSYSILRASNALPEMCAYVCPSEEQCEGSCLEKIFCERPLPIRDIQLAVCRLARRSGLTGVSIPAVATGGSVAVVGGGPAGIAAAVRLLEKGHRVTIIERNQKLGGTPDTIIPGDRYSGAETEVDAILAPAIQAGRLDLRLGQALGREVSLEDLRRQFDAVLVALGLGGSVSLGKADGVVDALAFLNDAKRGAITALPDKVAVLGGGNTAMDAGVTAIEKGARDVYLVYRRSLAEMPAWPKEREHFQERGGHILILTQPLAYVTDAAGKVTGLNVARTELGAEDASGRRKPVAIPGSESVLPVGLVIEALGQEAGEAVRAALPGVEFARSGRVRTKGGNSLATSLDRVFVAGDLVNGGTTAVRGVAEGMKAADEIHGILARGDSRS